MRIWGRLIAFVVLLGIVSVPALFFGVTESGGTTTEDTTIRSYDADFTIADDGDLEVVEKLAVDFPSSGKHGIFRFFDLSDTNEPRARRAPEDFTATRDGEADEVKRQRQGVGRFVNFRIGRESETLTPGVHTYELRYTIPKVLIPGDGDEARLNWNLIPGGWQQAIDRARLTVHLPADSSGDVECHQGFGATGGCTVEGAGTDTLTISASDLPPRTPVTLDTTLAMAAPDQDLSPWPLRWRGVFGPSGIAAVLVLALAALAGWRGNRRGARTREEKPSFPVMYAPPEGIAPAQAAYVFQERVGKPEYVATLLDAASRDLAVLEHEDKDWTITGRGDWDAVDPVTRDVGRSLGLTAGSTFQARHKNVSDGKVLAASLAEFQKATSSWARKAGLVSISQGSFAGGALVVLALVLAVALAFIPTGMSLLALVPGMYGVGALELLGRGSGTKRTEAGRRMWSHVGGFRRMLATPSSEQRFDFSGRKELYTAYIPWAVAFGVADEWAKKYRVETGEEPPTPSYFGAYAGSTMATTMVSDFSSTVNSAMSAYSSSQSSSGGSGGGGGGGGGGGSW